MIVAANYLIKNPEDFSKSIITHETFAANLQVGALWERAWTKETAGEKWEWHDLSNYWQFDESDTRSRTGWSPEDLVNILPKVVQSRAWIKAHEERMLEIRAMINLRVEMMNLSEGITSGEIDFQAASAVVAKMASSSLRSSVSTWESISIVSKRLCGQVVEVYEGKAEMTLPMHCRSMQHALGGWRLGRMVMIEAITSGHKTTIARQAAYRLACDHGMPAYVVTIEDPKEDIAARTVAEQSDGGVSVTELMTGKLDQKALGSMISTVNDIFDKNAPFFLDHRPLRIGQAVAAIHDAAARGAKMVCLDFFQLLNPDRPGAPKDTSFWEYAAGQLQAAASVAQVALIVTIQPTQEATREALAGTPLSIGSMRGGSAIAQACFGVLALDFLYDDNKNRITDKINLTPHKWKSARTGATIVMALKAAFDSISDASYVRTGGLANDSKPW